MERIFFNQKIYPLSSKALQKPNTLEGAGLPKSTSIILLTISLVGLCIFQLNSLAAYLNSPGNLINDTISSLVYAPNGWLQTAAFYILSLSIMALAVLLQLKAPVKLNLGAIILALIGFGLILLGTFPTQFPGHPFMAGIHKWTAFIVFTLLPVAGFFVAATFKKWNYRFLYKYSIAANILQLVFVFTGGALLLMHIELLGLFERVSLWNAQIWLTGICLYFLLAETKHDFPVISKNRPVTKPAVYCFLYMYGSMLMPVSLSLLKTAFR
jgi:hypothetical protein